MLRIQLGFWLRRQGRQLSIGIEEIGRWTSLCRSEVRKCSYHLFCHFGFFRNDITGLLRVFLTCPPRPAAGQRRSEVPCTASASCSLLPR